jgi:hypothetical protein
MFQVYPTTAELAALSNAEVIALANQAKSELVSWGCFPGDPATPEAALDEYYDRLYAQHVDRWTVTAA